MKTIAVANQKGGVGKSTTTFHLARAALLAGLRCLVVDLDPQGNLSASLVAEPLPDDAVGVADALSLRSDERLATVLVDTVWPGVDLAPTVGDNLALVRDELVVAGAGREGRLRAELTALAGDYDLALIDCPPSLDQLTINALTAADDIIVVTHSKLWSSTGLAHLLNTIRAVKEHYNPGLEIAGIVVNQHDATTTSGAHWLGELQAAAEERELAILGKPIPRRVVIADAVEASMGLDQWPTNTVEIEDQYREIFYAISPFVIQEAKK